MRLTAGAAASTEESGSACAATSTTPTRDEVRHHARLLRLQSLLPASQDLEVLLTTFDRLFYVLQLISPEARGAAGVRRAVLQARHPVPLRPQLREVGFQTPDVRIQRYFPPHTIST
jgi:hypothetical protein